MNFIDDQDVLVFEEVIVHTFFEDEDIIEYVGDVELEEDKKEETEHYEIIFEEEEEYVPQPEAPKEIEIMEVSEMEPPLSDWHELVEEIQCMYCALWFKDAYEYYFWKKHLSLHVPPKNTWCDICRRHFAMGYFKTHLKRQHLLRRYTLLEDHPKKMQRKKISQRKLPVRKATQNTYKWDKQENKHLQACKIPSKIPQVSTKQSLWDITPVFLNTSA